MKTLSLKLTVALLATILLSCLPARTVAQCAHGRLSCSRSHDDGDSDDEEDPRFKPPPPPTTSNGEARVDDSLMCGCSECTSDVLNRDAGGFTCGDRIMSLMEFQGVSEEEACIRVARTEFRNTCGPQCDPGRCDGRTIDSTQLPSTYCGCKHCNADIWNRETEGGFTCGARISYLTDFEGVTTPDACALVAGAEFPQDDLCGLCDPARCEPVHGTREGERCGCSRCVDAVWNLDADGFTCGQRIEFLIEQNGGDEEADACRQVAQVEFPDICGTNCDPDVCDAPLTARTDLYCFPSFHERTRFRNVWGFNTVEVKQSEEICNHNNFFTNTTVQRLSKDEVMLQFKKVGDKWAASEIRIRLPEDEMPFQYGTFSFGVKSVEVIDTDTNLIVAEELPPSLILSMHSWDATENYAIHENFNHQVSIDIGRFDDKSGPDAQFVVQPAIPFNTHRFYTGDNSVYQQARRTYMFDWRPAEIEFYSDAGEEVSFSYSTQRSLEAGEPDFTQCLPADIELRLSLWNLYGVLPPTELAMKDSYVVEVVIDDFSYTPSGLESVPNGAACTRDCHCGNSSKCFGNVCTEALESYERFPGVFDSTQRSSNSNIAQKEQAPPRVAVGFALFGGAVVALALIVTRRFKKHNSRPMAAVMTPDFDVSPTVT